MLIIGIAGGTGSGKTTVVRKILERLPIGEVSILPQDSYYRDSSHLPLEERLEINFDHPDSIEFELLTRHLKDLRKGKTIEQPIYSYLTCTRAAETIPVKPCHVIIVEGILVLTNPELRKMMDLKFALILIILELIIIMIMNWLRFLMMLILKKYYAKSAKKTKLL